MQIIETNRHSGGESLISCLAVRFRPVEDVKELIRSSAGVPVSGLDALSSAAYGPSSCADNYDSAGPRWNLILIIRGFQGLSLDKQPKQWDMSRTCTGMRSDTR